MVIYLSIETNRIPTQIVSEIKTAVHIKGRRKETANSAPPHVGPITRPRAENP